MSENQPITWANTTVKLGALKPWQRNPRRINAKEADRLAQSFDEFGQVETVAIGPDNEVYNGHQRLTVLLKKHGPDYEIEARQSSQALTEKQREKLTVYLHRGAVGEWDIDALSGWDVNELVEWGFGAEEVAGWGEAEKAQQGDGDAEPQTDRAEELRQLWGVELGQLWQIGEHRLICGDCTNRATVERVMGGERAEAVVTDPPYGQNQNGVTNDEPEKLTKILSGCICNLPIKNAVVVSFASPRTFPEWLDLTRGAGHKFERMLWLYKAAQETFPWRGWLLKSEAILISTVGKGQWQDVHPFSHDCYYKSEVSGQLPENSGWHGSVKPLDVVTDLTARVSNDGAIVYEPFAGSGTTLVACQNLNRRCRAVEISPAYCAVILQRMADAFPGIDIHRIAD